MCADKIPLLEGKRAVLVCERRGQILPNAEEYRLLHRLRS